MFKRFNKFEQADEIYSYGYDIEEKKTTDRKDKKGKNNSEET